MSMNLAEKTWPQIEEYLKSSKHIIVPVGSTEQHGPTGLIGIDFLSAWEIAKVVGEKTNTLVAPPLCFGMAVHHMAFPGTITLSPLTYVQVVTEIIQSLAKNGFRKFTFINGHGGNIAPLTTAFCQAQQNDENYDIKLFNWWHLPEVTAYESKNFGNENGFHATCGEISVTMFTHPDAYKNVPKMDFKPTPERPHWPMSPKEFRLTFSDGRMGSNPALCSEEHGKMLFNLAVDSICQKLE
ncbi:creatininase family protein [Bdellovibrio svalbardensis]|uniref:Creatininase family protein n=1 Tax=Bdellovibrio svalbardensis TaxID=2972972 RepID=A0ABT6DQY4_9BACT|nr:creatininase family protein [Bdellovibrio svalbardensis]MDG0818236.1 creatininase family protein [Bdellovibrio svalbardensis]